jgi:glyoxylase-like metal-dependent hydrolase (beta-lactamase superfamily II)
MKTIQSLFMTTVCFVFTAYPLAVSAGEFDWPLERITDKIYAIYGPLELPNSENRGFRNTAVIVLTSDGVVVFDPGGSEWAGERIAEKLRSLTDKPIVAVFNSHAHGDHWLGNEGIKKAYPSAVLYAHPNMKAKVEGTEGERWLNSINRLTDGKANGEKVVAPDKTVDDGDVIDVGDTKFRIYHTGPAHTDNDIAIEIVGENALFTGDLARNHFLGMMENDASFKGNIAAIDFMLEKNFRHYILAHGRAGGAQILKEYRAYLTTLKSTVSHFYDEGLADYEMKPEVVKALADYQQWAGFDKWVGPNISRVYLEIEAEEF